MSDSTALNLYLKKSGKKKAHIVEKTGVSRPRLETILENPETATYEQALILEDELSILPSDMGKIFLRSV